MANYLVAKVNSSTTSYSLRNTEPSKPYLRVSNSYLPLTTNSKTGLQVKVNGNKYNIQESYSTSITSTINWYYTTISILYSILNKNYPYYKNKTSSYKGAVSSTFTSWLLAFNSAISYTSKSGGGQYLFSCGTITRILSTRISAGKVISNNRYSLSLDNKYFTATYFLYNTGNFNSNYSILSSDGYSYYGVSTNSTITITNTSSTSGGYYTIASTKSYTTIYQ